MGRLRRRRRAARRCRWTAAPAPRRTTRSSWSARTAATTPAARSRAGRWPPPWTGCVPARCGSARTSAATGSRPTWWRCRTASTTAGSRSTGRRSWWPGTSAARCCPTSCAAGRRCRRLPRPPRRTSGSWWATTGSTRTPRPGPCTSAAAGGRSGCAVSRATSSSRCRPAALPVTGLLTCHARNEAHPPVFEVLDVTEVD